MTRTILAMFLLLSTPACVGPADADSAASALGGGNRPPPRPPKEAVDACASASEGDACAFDHDGHHVTGTCAAGPVADAPLACKPERMPPPPEAFAACDGADAGDPCDVTTPEGETIEGACITGPEGDEPLACAP